tara:strand:- start:1631 stop:2050 length:420 start_codon:yes stop_codon:yes gene_type:complete
MIKYLLTIIYIFIAEFIWLYLINSKRYISITEKIQKTKFNVNIKYAILSYVLVLISIFYVTVPFVISKISINDNNKIKNIKIFIYSFIIGFLIYGIYNLTSLSIYTNYTFFIASIDTLWGGILYSTSTLLFFNLKHMLN